MNGCTWLFESVRKYVIGCRNGCPGLLEGDREQAGGWRLDRDAVRSGGEYFPIDTWVCV